MRIRVTCVRCGKVVRPPIGCRTYFHRCVTKRRRLSIGELEAPGLTVEERRAAAWAFLGGER